MVAIEAPALEEVGSEAVPEVPKKQVRTDFGDTPQESTAMVQSLQVAQSKLNEALIFMDQMLGRQEVVDSVYVVVKMIENDPVGVAIDRDNMRKELVGAIIEVRSQIRAVQQELKIMDRIGRSQKLFGK